MICRSKCAMFKYKFNVHFYINVKLHVDFYADVNVQLYVEMWKYMHNIGLYPMSMCMLHTCVVIVGFV